MDWPEFVILTRQKYGLSRADFGRLVGVGYRTVQRWEQGETLPSRDQAELIRRMNDIVDPPSSDHIKKALLYGGVAAGIVLIFGPHFKNWISSLLNKKG